MRHFKRADKTFFSDIEKYIESMKRFYSPEHTECINEALGAADDYYEKSATLSFEPVCQSVPFPNEDDGYGIVLPKKQPTFQQNLFRLIDEKQLKDSAVYKKADIDRRLFSKIRSDVDYHPAKSTAIKLCLSLKLNIAETERLLETAGYCLSLSDTGDLIVRYCIEQGRFDLIDVNEALDYFDMPVL